MAKPFRDLYIIAPERQSATNMLSPRQMEVAQMLASGKRYKRIADSLSISESTVTKHVNAIHKRLGISSREELIQAIRPSRRKNPI